MPVAEAENPEANPVDGDERQMSAQSGAMAGKRFADTVLIHL